MRRITELFHELIIGRKDVSVPELAAHLGVAASTLYAQVNPYGGTTHKLGADDAEKIADRLGDYTPYIEFLQARGFVVSRADAAIARLDEGNIWPKMASLATCLGQIADAIKKGMEDGALTRAELMVIFEAATCGFEVVEELKIGAQKACGEMGK